MKTYGPTMHRKMSNVQNAHSWPQPKYLRSIAWSMTVCVNQTLPQLINISHRMLTGPLLQHCQDSVINRTEAWYVKKPVLVHGKAWRLATNSLKVVRTYCAGALYGLNLSWFSAFDFIKNMILYAYDRKCTEVPLCVYWNYQNSAWFDKVIAKIKWCSSSSSSSSTGRCQMV